MGSGELFLNPVLCRHEEDKIFLSSDRQDKQRGRQKTRKEDLGCRGRTGLQEVWGMRGHEGSILPVWSCCQGQLISIREGRARGQPCAGTRAEEPASSHRQRVQRATGIGEEKKGGRELMGSKVEGKKSRTVWEGKSKGERGRESQCKEKVTAPPGKLSQASQVRGMRRQSPKPASSEILLTAATAL